mmetsp:Transcript_31673/g.101515  ORF Transcript_31673/g.101515 Transcript_31673/m.101515 type:complete len:110 (+) Transcript_31673:2284-2613(+)
MRSCLTQMSIVRIWKSMHLDFLIMTRSVRGSHYLRQGVSSHSTGPIMSRITPAIVRRSSPCLKVRHLNMKLNHLATMLVDRRRKRPLLNMSMTQVLPKQTYLPSETTLN